MTVSFISEPVQRLDPPILTGSGVAAPEPQPRQSPLDFGGVSQGAA
jgi:hypothetical protein